MTVETATYIPDLNPALPAGTDGLLEGDNHLRLLKSTIKATLPNLTGPMTATHTVLNGVDGRLATLETGTTQAIKKDGTVAMTADLDLGTHKIINVVDPTTDQQAATKKYVDTASLPKAGGTMAGAIAMGTNKITGLGTPVDPADATTKAYVDARPSSHTMTVLQKTADYTMVDGDNGYEINFTTSGTTLNLPAAASRNGLWVVVRNSAASGDVTLDPNASELLDGLASRKLRPGDCVVLRCDGAAWQTVSGTYSYKSSAQVMAISTKYTLAHGLGETPTYWAVWVVNKITEFGYIPGDRVEMDHSALGTSYGGLLVADATNITFGTQQTYGLNPGRAKDTNAQCGYINPTKWDLFAVAEVRKG